MSKYKIANYGFRGGSAKSKKSKSKRSKVKKSNYRGSSGVGEIKDDFFKLYDDCRSYFFKRIPKGKYSKSYNTKNNKQLQLGLIALAGFIVVGSIINFPIAICLCLIGAAIYLNK